MPVSNNSKYFLRRVNGNEVEIRPIQDEDVYEVLNEESDIEQRYLIMARCVKRVNSIDREKWSFEDWLKFIKTMNFKDKNLILSEIRKISYQDKSRSYLIYF